MFEKALIRRLNANQEIDVGLLAETLLFYQNTHILIDRGSMINLAKKAGADTVLRLIKDGHIHTTFFRDDFAVMSQPKLGPTRSQLLQWRLTGHADEPGKKYDKEDLLRTALQQAGYDTGQAKDLARKFAHHIPGEKLVLSGQALNIVDMTMQDVQDANYTTRVATLVTKEWFPQFRIPDNWTFKVHLAGTVGEVDVDTNFDFGILNKQSQNGARGEFSARNVLVEMLDARADMTFAAKHQSEFIGGPLRSSVLQAKFDLINLRRNQSSEDIKLFEELHLDGHRLREVINSGERSFSEFLDLLDKAHKFKEWLKGVSPDEGLAKEYYQAATKGTWIERLPQKAGRFLAVTGAGFLADAVFPGGLGTAIGLSLGTADTFLLDSVIKGWKPNQFVDRELKGFVTP